MFLMMEELSMVIGASLLYGIFTSQLVGQFILKPWYYHSHMTIQLNELRSKTWNWLFRWVLKNGKIMIRLT